MAGSIRTWRGSSVNDATLETIAPSTLCSSIWFGNPKTFRTKACFGRGGVRKTFRSVGVLAPYWSRNAASFTKSAQSTTVWGGGGCPPDSCECSPRWARERLLHPVVWHPCQLAEAAGCWCTLAQKARPLCPVTLRGVPLEALAAPLCVVMSRVASRDISCRYPAPSRPPKKSTNVPSIDTSNVGCRPDSVAKFGHRPAPFSTHCFTTTTGGLHTSRKHGKKEP